MDNVYETPTIEIVEYSVNERIANGGSDVNSIFTDFTDFNF